MQKHFTFEIECSIISNKNTKGGGTVKPIRILTAINISGSAVAWLTFLVNQFCKLRIVETGELWEATGYLFALMIGPLALLISLVFTVIAIILVCKRTKASKRVKYLVLNILCPIVTTVMLISCYFGNALSWM